ncbi:MAG: PPC domain-containing protein [Deltaproteobacteria bacterium]|nr:PPC domain-containing protein [Deltaproteobacteria bacterium]
MSGRILSVTLLLSLAGTGCGESVSLVIAPLDDQEVRVGETLNVDIPVSNPDEASLSFSFEMPDLPASGAEIYASGTAGGRLRWTPLASQEGAWSCTVRVSGGGGSDTETFVINVQSSDSAPVFIQPGAGGTYDLSREPCVAVHVEVKDDDSLPAAIRILERDPRIDGATLSTNGKQADWSWCPTPAQIDAADRYTLGLSAQDESHALVPHDYVIVLRGAGRPDCPGAPPDIVSTSPQDTLVRTALDYRVDAVVRDDVGLKDPPILYWSTEAPSDPAHPDVTAFRQLVFVSDGGDAYHAAIPNLGVPPGEERTIHYVVSATDNDDTEGAGCDHQTDSPLRSFRVAEGSGEVAGYCEACSASSQCDSRVCAAGASRFCAADCAACPATATCGPVTTVEGGVVDACVPAGLDCRGGGSCTDDAYEDNDSRVAAAMIAADLYTGLQVCSGDEDFYSVDLGAGSLDVTIDGWDAASADIDLQLLRADGTPLRSSAGIGSSENVALCVAGGATIVRVYGVAGDSGPYSLLVDHLPGSCCTDDALENNDSWSDATPLLVPGDTLDGQVCAADEDWFVFSGEAGRRASVDLLIDGTGDLDLELYDRDGMRRLASSAGTGTSEHAEADLAATDDYYVRVFGYRGAEDSYLVSYELIGSAGCSDSLSCPAGTVCDGTACVDDACTPGASTCPAGTFCPDAGGGGGSSDCVDPCGSSSECRAGYACKTFAEGGGCGAAGAGLDGDPCASFRNCAGSRVCLDWAGGYCAVDGCTGAADCPSGSRCIDAGGALGTCVEDCMASDDLCRLAEGHVCDCAVDWEGSWQWVCLAPGVYAPACF